MAKEFGWSEHFVLYELPLARAMLYMLALQQGNPFVWTVRARPEESRGPLETLSEERLKAMLREDAEVEI